MKRAVTSVALILGMAAAPAPAQEGDAIAPYPPEASAFLQAIIDLPHDRQAKVLDRLGVKPSQDMLNCVCRTAGYGSSSASQYWHPDTIGEFDPRYSCQHPGPPCIVSGYGCLRYPAPTDMSIWDSCARRHAAEDGSTLLDEMLAAQKRKAAATEDKLRKELKECRARYRSQLGQPANPMAGLDYLKAKGIPVMPPPSRVLKQMKRTSQTVEEDLARLMGKNRKAAAEKAQATLSDQLKKAYLTDANKQAALQNMAALGTAYVETELEELRKHRDEVQRTIKRLQAGEMSEETDLKLDRLKAKSWKMQKQQDQLNRDKSHLESFGKAVELGGDIASFQGIYDDATSGDNRKLAGAVIKSSELVKKYYDQFTGATIAAQDEILKAIRGNLKGVDPSDFASASRKREVLAGMSDMMGETIKIANMSVQTYDTYKSVEKTLKEVERLASSGRYSQAQMWLQLGMKAMSKLSAEAAAYLPPGMSDMMGFYSEALQTPEKFDKLIRQYVNKREGAAQITSDQANTAVMRKHLEKYDILDFLIRDQYLYKEAGLSAYAIDPADNDAEAYVLMPDADGEPIYLSQAQYDQLAELAYAYPILHERRMTDADVIEQFGQMGSKGKVRLDDIRNKVAQKLKDAERHGKIARMYGKKTITVEEAIEWGTFQNAVIDRLPKGCTFEASRMKALFGAYRDGDKQAVLDKVEAMGLRMMALDGPTEAGQ